MDLLFAPMRWFISVPALAYIPAIILLVANRRGVAHAPRAVLVAGLLWLAYALWETAVWFWWRTQSDQGGAPIRADLLLIAPVLLIATVVAIIAWWRNHSTAGA